MHLSPPFSLQFFLKEEKEVLRYSKLSLPAFCDGYFHHSICFLFLNYYNSTLR
jgi:hypothetical protein